MRKHPVRTVVVTLLVALLAATTLFAACAKPAPSPTPAPAAKPAPAPAPAPKPTAAPAAKPPAAPAPKPAPAPAAGDKIKVPFATVSPQMETYPPLVSINDMVNRNTNLAISTMAGSGSLSPILSVNAGEAQMGGIMTLPTSSLGYLGLEDFKGKAATNMRLVTRLGTLYQSFTTTTATNIKTIPDMKGKKIARFTAMTNAATDALLQAYGFDPQKDFQNIPVANYGLAFAELLAGRLDAFFAPFSGTQMLQLKEAGGKAAVVAIDTDKIAKAAAASPNLFLGIESVRVNPGDLPALELQAAVSVMGYPMVIIASKDTPEQVVSTYLKALLDRPNDVKALIWTMKYFSPQLAAVKPIYPYHPAAIKVFKDSGVWTDELEKAQQEALKR